MGQSSILASKILAYRKICIHSASSLTQNHKTVIRREKHSVFCSHKYQSAYFGNTQQAYSHLKICKYKFSKHLVTHAGCLLNKPSTTTTFTPTLNCSITATECNFLLPLVVAHLLLWFLIWYFIIPNVLLWKQKNINK